MPGYLILVSARGENDFIFLAKGTEALRITKARSQAAWFATRVEAVQRIEHLQQEYADYDFKLARTGR